MRQVLELLLFLLSTSGPGPVSSRHSPRRSASHAHALTTSLRGLGSKRPAPDGLWPVWQLRSAPYCRTGLCPSSPSFFYLYWGAKGSEPPGAPGLKGLILLRRSDLIV